VLAARSCISIFQVLLPTESALNVLIGLFVATLVLPHLIAEGSELGLFLYDMVLRRTETAASDSVTHLLARIAGLLALLLCLP